MLFYYELMKENKLHNKLTKYSNRINKVHHKTDIRKLVNFREEQEN